MSKQCKAILISLGWAGILLFLVVPLAWAGGWVAVTLDSLPVAPKAGETIQLGFMLRQHGTHPISVNWDNQPLKPLLLAENKETKESIEFVAEPEGPEGHFVVEVVFPGPGIWEWRIAPEQWGVFPEKFEPMTVLPASPVPVEVTAAPQDNPMAGGWLAVVGLISAAGVVLAVRQGYIGLRGGLGIGVVSLLIVLAGLFFGPSLVSNAESATRPQPELMPEPDLATYGRALFVAKGCSSCHIHSDLSVSVPGPFIGPNLTNYPNTPEFIHAWLKAPEEIRPETKMPNLNLSEDEIEALIAFLKPVAE